MRPKRCKRRPGSISLEFALVVPIFLILALAIMEFATLFFVRYVMLNAARDATRSYSIRETDSAGSIALATERLSSVALNFTVTATADSDSGTDRWVQVSTPVSEASLGDPLGLLGDGDLTVRVTMRQED